MELGKPAIAALLFVTVVPAAALAQKNSGALLPVNPVPAPAPVYRPAPAPAAPAAPAARGQNPQVEQLAQALPLDPATRELTNREPADIRGVERRLNLRESHGAKTDLRGRTPTTREIVDALAAR